MLALEIRELLLQLGRGMLAERAKDPLTATQWLALRYFSRANVFSRTLSEFAAYQATTRGTASQTIKSLEESGYIEREKSTYDGRSSILNLTDKARALLRDDPLLSVFTAIETLDGEKQQLLRDLLRQFVCRLGSDAGKSVGSCADCVFLLVRRLSAQGHAGKVEFFCQYVGLPVGECDLKLLCTSFRSKCETAAT